MEGERWKEEFVLRNGGKEVWFAWWGTWFGVVNSAHGDGVRSVSIFMDFMYEMFSDRLKTKMDYNLLFLEITVIMD